MNVKELLLIVCLALATTWGIEYLFFRKSQQMGDEIKSGQSFTVPQAKQDQLRPLNTEVDFVDTKRPAPTELATVEAEHARWVFSTEAASLDRLEFVRSQDGKVSTITTTFPVGITEREKRCFLVALNEETPYFYALIDRKDTDQSAELTYKAETPSAHVSKTYVVDKSLYKVTLSILVEPKQGKIVEPRLFFPAPIMPDIALTDVKSTIINDEYGGISKAASTKLEAGKGWFAPSLVGVDNRYFAYAMVNDPNHFAQRAYFHRCGQQDLTAILEGPRVTEPQSWTMTFYMGPKEEKAMAAVDQRLVNTLEYSGWLAPISRIMLKILMFFYFYLKNYGFAIIALTLLIKLLLLPFSIKGAQSMKKTGEMQRKLQYLQQKYKHDPEMLAQERAALIREHGMPGMAGCLPLLLQIPVFIALSRVLSSAIELYQAPFLWIPDLSASDPYYVLPVLIGVSMLLQSTTVEAKQKMQFIVMALIFGAVSVSFSSGLALYIFMSTILSVIQALVQNRLKVA